MLSMLILLLLQGNFTALRLGAQGSFPKPLSAQEERRCLELAAAGDQAARGKLIEHNLRLVAHIVKKYYTQIGGDTDDLISIGTLGLIKAVNTYNMEKKIKLATYAARCIENEVLMYLRKTRRLAGEVSLNDALDQEDEGSALSLMDVIRVEDTMLEDLNTRDACRQVRDAVEQCLPDREKLVIVRRYGLDGNPPQTQREVASQCGISRSYVSRIEKKALGKLREVFEEEIK